MVEVLCVVVVRNGTPQFVIVQASTACPAVVTSSTSSCRSARAATRAAFLSMGDAWTASASSATNDAKTVSWAWISDGATEVARLSSATCGPSVVGSSVTRELERDVTAPSCVHNFSTERVCGFSNTSQTPAPATARTTSAMMTSTARGRGRGEGIDSDGRSGSERAEFRCGVFKTLGVSEHCTANDESVRSGSRRR